MAAAGGTVLVIDDESAIRELIVLTLEMEGFAVVSASNAMEAYHILENNPPAAVILDLMMPSISGVEVLEHIRKAGNTPVMIVSALASEANRIKGLDLGADDYMVKPFSPGELAARVRALLRRSGMAVRTPLLQLDGLVIDAEGREVSVHGQTVDLAAKEFDLLVFLASSPGRVFTREEILKTVWNSSEAWQQAGTVTEHIRRLRLKIEDDPETPRWIQTVRGVGYRFERRRKARDTAAISAVRATSDWADASLVLQ